MSYDITKRVVKMKIGTCAISAEEVKEALEKEKTMYLATCAGNRVTIRPMSHINDGLTVFFQTGRDSLKVQQIMDNPNVAICVGTYELEGVAYIMGHPFDNENSFFTQKYKEKHPKAFEKYSALDEEIVVKVLIRQARQWRYIDGKPFLAQQQFDLGAHYDP